LTSCGIGQGRLARAVLKRPDYVGVGIDEKLALVVQGHHVGVIGLSNGIRGNVHRRCSSLT
jgi:cyanophycinase-like exopeptidase